MKRFTLFALLAIFTVAPLILTGCDDDPWYDNYNWRNRNWYGRNDQGGNQGQGNSSIEDEGACLVGLGKWSIPIPTTKETSVRRNLMPR